MISYTEEKPCIPSNSALPLTQYQVFVQSHGAQHFVASVIGIPNVSVEGVTEAEAIAKIKTALESQLETGKIVTIEINTPASPSKNDPWIKHMGLFTDDPTFDDFLAEVQTYRLQADTRMNISETLGK